MKKTKHSLTFLTLSLILPSSLVQAADHPATTSPEHHQTTESGISPNEGSDTCGLGWMVTQQKTLVGTTTRATTNNFLPPVFSITTGTSGCKSHPFAKNDAAAVQYFASNFYPLSAEIALGQGEYLAGLVEIMGCDTAVTSDFGQIAQQSFTSLAEDADASIAIEHFRNVIQNSALLSQSCKATS